MLLGGLAQRLLVAVVLEVGEHEDDAAAAQEAVERVEAGADRGAALGGTEGEEIADQREHVAAALLRRDVELRLLGEEEEADLVVVAHRREREDGADLGGDLLLELGAGAEELRAREIAREHGGELALLLVAPHVRAAGASGHVPVERSDVVARRVLAHLRELHAPALEDAQVLAAEGLGDELARADLDPPDLREDLLRYHVRGLLRSRRSCERCPRR